MLLQHSRRLLLRHCRHTKTTTTATTCCQSSLYVYKKTPTFSNSFSTQQTPPEKELFGVKTLRRLGWLPDQIQGKDSFKRWWLLAPAMMNHLCLGGIFGWSIFNDPLTKLHGVVVSASDDWTLGDIGLTFSLVMGGFAWGALLGKYLEAYGPRTCSMIGAVCLGSGFGLGALAIHLHCLPLLYVGGCVWGVANGFSYVPPVANLIRWYPDRKGFASGACLLGFGGGALVAAPVYTYLLEYFRKFPTYLGLRENLNIINENGSLYTTLDSSSDKLHEVVVATLADVKTYGLSEGVYLVGSGSTGATETFMILGGVYCTLVGLGALTYRTPSRKSLQLHENASAEVTKGMTKFNVDVSTGTNTPQFWLMWSSFGLSITGTYGILACGKTMLSDIYGTAMPDIVTVGFAATFVAAMSAANVCGRIFWSNISDYMAKKQGGDPFYARKRAFGMMLGLAPPMYLAIVWSAHAASGYIPLVVFCGSVCGILSSFGGAAATRPALCGDMFGLKHVGIFTARQLSVVLPSAWAGPKIATYFRQKSINDALIDLSKHVEENEFIRAFGSGKENIKQMIESNVVTINRMLELCPPGTIDPTPFVYDQTMYCMAGLQAVAFLANVALKPIPKQLHEGNNNDNSNNNNK